MTTLYLVRHGQTKDNIDQIMQGQTQGELTDEGRRQACEVGELLATKHIDAIVCSDLKRSVDTARIIASRIGLAEIEQTALLRERDWGDFTGRYIPSLKGETWPDNVESLDTLLARASHVIAWIKERHPGERVVAVGHGIINKAIQAVYYQKQMSEVTRMQNAEVRQLEL